MAIFLDRIDAVPLQYEEFSFEFEQWLSVLVDQLNELLRVIQENINDNLAQSFTAAEIGVLDTAGLPDGVVLYDTDNHVYVGKQNGTLVQFDTSAYP